MLLPLPSAPIATDWSDSCRAGFAPAEDWRLLTAHVEIQHKDPFLADPGTIEDVLAVENDVVPFDRADVLGAGLRPGLPW